ncbi:CD225/dispanin family protein [Nocardiopsis coralliicola]
MSYGTPQGPPPGQPAGGPPPEVGLVGVILSLLCCWPLGIPALVFQLKIDKQWQTGDYAGAQDSAKKATTFRNIAFVLGTIAIVLGVVSNLMLAGMSAATY